MNALGIGQAFVFMFACLHTVCFWFKGTETYFQSILSLSESIERL